MTDLNRPHTFDGNGILCRCGKLKDDKIHFKRINPHEGASPAVDASGPQPAARHELSWANDAFQELADIAKSLADTVDAQAAEIASLKAVNAKLCQTIEDYGRAKDHMAEKFDKRTEQNAALREALDSIKQATDPAEGNAKASERAYDAFQIARAALKGTSDDRE